MLKPFRIAVLISGGGTTLQNLLNKRQRSQLDAEIGLVVSSNPAAGGIEFAKADGIDFEIVDHRQYDNQEEFSKAIFDSIRLTTIDLVVLGGFLRRLTIPEDFANRIINIHPSLIPSFCGQGHYGRRVHQAVLDYGCKVSGCTVHFVDDQYDHGPIIAQSTVPVNADDTPESLAARVFDAECELYPQVINALAARKIEVTGRKVRWSVDDGQ